MVKVLQLGFVYNIGGIQTFVMNYYRNINREYVQFDFVNIYKEDFYFKDEIEKLGGKIFNVTSYYKHPIKYIKEIKKIVDKEKYDIIHVNMNSAAMLWPLIAAKLSKARVVISHAHNSSSDKGIMKKIVHSFNKHFIPLFSNYYFACSDKAGEWFYSKKVRKSNNYFVINNAIDTEKFYFSYEIRDNKRKELDINKQDLVIGTVGRFSKQKNQSFLVDVFQNINNINENVKMLLVGSGELLPDVRKKVIDYKLENNIIFLEKRNDISELMAVMDVFVLPSLYEGLPLVGVEAQSSGLPCLFSDSITKELKLNCNVEYLPLSLGPEVWADKIINIICRKTDRRRINVKKYDININAKRLQDLYKKMLIEKGCSESES